MTLVLAHGREELEAFLLSLQVTLALVAAGLLAGTAVLVRAVLGVGLAPLDDLGLRLEALDAESLGRDAGDRGTPPPSCAPMIRHLNGLLARLNESFAREKAFSANLAHELRTPLAELRAVAEVALKWPDEPSSGPEALAEIRAIGLQMESVVVNLLALARCEEKHEPSPDATSSPGCPSASWRQAAGASSPLRLRTGGWSCVSTCRRGSPWSPTARSWR